MAFLNMMFLPARESIDLVKGSTFAFDQIDISATQGINEPKNTNYDELRIDGFVAPDNGYIMVYLSNEGSKVTKVYFDDLSVEVNEGLVRQVSNYYPFGLQHNSSWTRPTDLKNNFLYNAGSELNEATKNYETFFRQYDAALGRFTAIDPVAAKYGSQTPYNYAFNDPIALNDPMGDDPLEDEREFYGENYQQQMGYFWDENPDYHGDVNRYRAISYNSGNYNPAERVGDWSAGSDSDDWSLHEGSETYRTFGEGFVNKNGKVYDKKTGLEVKNENGEVYVRDPTGTEWVSAREIVNVNNPNQNKAYRQTAVSALGGGPGDDYWRLGEPLDLSTASFWDIISRLREASIWMKNNKKSLYLEEVVDIGSYFNTRVGYGAGETTANKTFHPAGVMIQVQFPERDEITGANGDYSYCDAENQFYGNNMRINTEDRFVRLSFMNGQNKSNLINFKIYYPLTWFQSNSIRIKTYNVGLKLMDYLRGD